jgi:hypothetical protein
VSRKKPLSVLIEKKPLSVDFVFDPDFTHRAISRYPVGTWKVPSRYKSSTWPGTIWVKVGRWFNKKPLSEWFNEKSPSGSIRNP